MVRQSLLFSLAKMVRFHLSSCEFALSTPERAPSAYISVAFSACRNGDGHENNAIGGYEFAVQVDHGHFEGQNAG